MPDPIVVTTGGPSGPAPVKKTILAIIREVCPVIGLPVPSAVFASTRREHVELAALANEMAQRIAWDTHDWTKLKTLCTIVGDGVETAFDLPGDFHRMLKKARLWPSATPNSPLTHYPDSDQWLGLEVQNFQRLLGAWTLIGEQIHIKPVLAADAQASFYYISKDYALDAETNEPHPDFDADTDLWRLDDRVLRLGMIWQWKANKGFAYAENMATYEEALMMSIGADKGSNLLTVGRVRGTIAETVAWPGTIVP